MPRRPKPPWSGRYEWASLGALKAHAAAPHMKAYADRTRELIASRVIHVLSPV